MLLDTRLYRVMFTPTQFYYAVLADNQEGFISYKSAKRAYAAHPDLSPTLVPTENHDFMLLVAYEKTRIAPLCCDCMMNTHGFEPDMGDGETSFTPGSCEKCGKDGIVFILAT